MDDRQWREFFDATMGVPPGRLAVAPIRRRMRQRRVTEAASVAAGVVLAVFGLTATFGVFRAAPAPAAGPVARIRPAIPQTVYVAYRPGHGNPSDTTLIPIRTATNVAGKPIPVPCGCSFVITPNAKTIYAANNDNLIIPVSTVTGTLGTPIRLGHYRAFRVVMDPNGKVVYAIGLTGGITPINIATNKPGKLIDIGLPGDIVFSPDGDIAYMIIPSAPRGKVIPVNTVTGRPGKPIPVGDSPQNLAITPDGKTLYVTGLHSVTPISTATDKPGKRIHVGLPPAAIVVTPDGKTVYLANTFGSTAAVTPISTATNTAGPEIPVHAPAEQLVVTPDGKTVYVASFEGNPWVTPISTATNKAGKPIFAGRAASIAITPDGKTVYAAVVRQVVPISTATSTAGTPIRIGLEDPENIAIAR